MSSNPHDLVVRLNLEAMNALFPEGSQARVELQNAVLTQTTGKYVKQMLTSELKAVVDTAVGQTVKDINVPAMIREQFAISPNWIADLVVVPGSRVEDSIRKNVQAQFDNTITEIVQASVAAHLETHLQQVEKRVDEEVAKQITKITQELLTRKVNDAIEAARKALL